MPTNKRLFSQDAAAASGTASSAQGLVLHLDANDEDSIESGGANQGNGSGTWFDISTHDLNVPLVDKASNLQLHLNGSDTTSYSGSGFEWTDISGNTSNNGTIDGATFASDTRGYFTFDGSNDDIEIATNSNLILGTVKTFEFWINFHAVGDSFFVRSNAGYSDYAYNFHSLSSSGNKLGIAVYNSGGSVVVLDRDVPITLNTFHHIVVTFADRTSGSAFKIYKDGTLASSGTLTGDADNDTSFRNYIGSQGGTSSFLDGDISAIRCYDVALTPSEVAQNFRQGNFLSYDSIYSTDLAMNLDAANYTSGTWSDSAGSNDAIVNDAKFDKELGNFFDFDGSNDTITVSATASAPVDFSSETYSIGMWANIETLANDKVLIGKFTTGSNRAFQIQISSSNKLMVLERGSGNFAIESTQTFTANTWFYFLYTRAASEAKIYVNGVLDNTSSASETINDAGTTDITIGNQAGTSEFFTGKIGQVKIYSATLTPAQVAQNYLATKDNYPNGNNGTINGANFDNADLGASANTNFFEMSSDTITSNFAFSNWGTTAWTIAFFARAHSANDGYLFGTGNTTGAAISFRNLSPPKAFLISSTGNTEIAFTLNQFKHFVFTYDGSGATKGYGNGVLEDSNTSVASHFSSTANFRLGNYGGSGTHFDGDIGQFKIFQKELSASEVSALYDLDKATYNLT